MSKEWCPGVKAKPCSHGITPWFECAECTQPGRHSATAGSDAWPLTTTHIDGTPRTFYNDTELQAACKAAGVRHRPDTAFLNAEYQGYDIRTGKQRVSEGSGRGMKGQWV